MTSALYSGLSGVLAFSRKIAVSAHNLANVNTDGFKKQRAVLEEAAPQGVRVRVETIEAAGPRTLELTEAGETLVEKSNVDIGEQTASLLLARRFYEASLKAIETENERLGTLLDVLE